MFASMNSMQEEMKKAGNMLERCIFIIYALFWCGIVFLNLFYSSKSYSCKKKFLLSNTQLLVLGILTTVIIWILSYLSSKKYKDTQSIKININTLTIALFIVEIYIFYNIYFHTNHWDPACIFKNAEMISRGDSNGLANGYFSKYPNNQCIVYLQSVMIRLNRVFGVLDSEGIFFMILVQCLLTSWTGKILYDNLRLLNCSKKYSMMGWILYVILLGLSGWNIVTYTDMMGLIFPVAVFRVYLALKNKKKVMLKWLVIIALTYWGAKIKVTVVIVFLALIINEAIQFLRDFEYQALLRKLKTLVKIVVAGSICVLIYSNMFNAAIQSTGLVIDKEANLGPLHWMMMGMNPVNDGVYYRDDVKLSEGVKDSSERTQVQIETIKERLHEYGFKGFIKHMGKKSLINFNDGTFAWGAEGGFYDVVYPDKNSVVSPFLKSLYYNGGSRYLYLSTLEQFAWIMILCSSPGIIIVKKRRESLAIVLALIGIIMFNLMFEARARYMILYVPFFIMAAMMSLQGCEEYLRIKLIRETSANAPLPFFDKRRKRK